MSTAKLHRVQGRLVRLGVWFRTLPTVVVVLALVAFLAVATLVTVGVLDREQATTATTRADGTQATLDKVADPLAALCATDATVRARVGDDVCFTAQRAVNAPADGTAGAPGRGIVATVIRGGHLVVSYTDGAQIDVGAVAGQLGVTGRGIATSQITAGRLELVFTDGTVQDVGAVVGARGADGSNGTNGTNGRGITSTAITGGRLIVTYSDGATEDAGPAPPGPEGPAGRDAELPSSYTNTYPDGTKSTCSRNGGPADGPVYDCTERG